MKEFFKKSLCLAALAIGLNSESAVTLISPRSLVTDGALRVSADGVKQNLFGQECDGVWGTLSLAAGGGRTFRDRQIAQCLFGPDITCNDNCSSISIAGSCVTTRSAKSWLADYFGLPTDYQSIVTFKPQVTHAFLDFNAYIGLDTCCQGMYFTLRIPFEHVRYELNMRETIIAEGSAAYDPGYFSEAQVPRINLVTSFTDFVAKGKTPNLNGIVDGAPPSSTASVTSKAFFDPLTCAKMYSCTEKSKNRIADLAASFGWNLFLNCDYHLGLYVIASAPTGNRPCGEFLFEPIAGGGHHWNLGGGISGHVLLWQCDDEESEFGFYIDGSVTHMFKSHQRRFFDLKNKPNSRYMLAEKMTTPSANLFAGTTAGTDGLVTATNVPSAQFANEYTSVANLTCCEVEVSVDAQGQVVAWFNYSTPCFSWDLGYEFWGRSCDRIRESCECPCPLDSASKTWALKGDAHVYGFVNSDSAGVGVVAPNNPIALSATESGATIHAGTNVPLGTTCTTVNPPTALPTATPPDTRTNPFIDNPQFAFAGATTTATNQLMIEPGLMANVTGIGQQRTSFQPVFLSSSDVDICGAQSKGISHTVFTHISYTWNRGCCGWSWNPYLGVGGKAEFSQNFGCNNSCDDNNSCSTSASSTCSTNCNTNCCDDECPRCNFSLWSVWLKGGLSFD